MFGAISVVVFGSLVRSGIPGLFRWVSANILIVPALVALAMDDTSPAPLTIVAALGGLVHVCAQHGRNLGGAGPSVS